MDCFQMLLNGDILNAAICPFLNVPGFEQYFIALIIFALEATIFIKSENTMLPTIVGVILSAGTIWAQLAAEGVFYNVLFIFMWLNIAALLFTVYMGWKK